MKEKVSEVIFFLDIGFLLVGVFIFLEIVYGGCCLEVKELNEIWLFFMRFRVF